MNTIAPRIRTRLVVLAVMVPVVMAAFALVAMPKLYSLWCEATGSGIRPPSPEPSTLGPITTGRFVEVFFAAKVFDSLPIEFIAEQSSLQVEVGKEARNLYRLKNTSDRVLSIRPIHQISPISATPFFIMRICFCFNDQILQPGESKEFPVVFSFSPELDPRTVHVSVCYSLFTIIPGTQRSVDQERIQQQIEGAGGVVSPTFRVKSAGEIQRMQEQERVQPGKVP